MEKEYSPSETMEKIYSIINLLKIPQRHTKLFLNDKGPTPSKIKYKKIQLNNQPVELCRLIHKTENVSNRPLSTSLSLIIHNFSYQE